MPQLVPKGLVELEQEVVLQPQQCLVAEVEMVVVDITELLLLDMLATRLALVAIT
jgi:hypothetical protein